MNANFAQSTPEIIFRYSSIRAKDLDLLERGRLWFSNPNRFNDPFELFPRMDGLIKQFEDTSVLKEFAFSPTPPPFHQLKEKRRNQLQSTRHSLARKWAREFRQESGNEFAMVCFACEPEHDHPDNILMWSHYADSHRGFAFAIRTERLVANSNRRSLRRVDYRDDRYHFKTQMDADHLFWKASCWRYEHEWRLVSFKSDLQSGIEPQDKPGEREGHFLEIGFQDLARIYLGMEIPDQHRNTLLKLVSRPELRHIEVCEMEPSSTAYTLVPRRLSKRPT